MRPITAHQRVREYRDGLLAVAPWEGRIAARVDSLRVDHEAMSTFLTEITVRFPRRYWIVFLDGDGAHVSHDLGVPRNMHLELLPPYIPELNPVEPIWDYVREHYFANRAFATVDRVASQLCKAFRDLDATPERVRSISLFDWVKAAN